MNQPCYHCGESFNESIELDNKYFLSIPYLSPSVGIGNAVISCHN